MLKAGNFHLLRKVKNWKRDKTEKTKTSSCKWSGMLWKAAVKLKILIRNFVWFFMGFFPLWVLFRLVPTTTSREGGLCRSQHLCKEELGGCIWSCRITGVTAEWSIIPMDLPMTAWAEWQRRKHQTNVCPNTRNQGAAQDYSMEKTSPPESHVLKNTQKCPSLAWIRCSSEEMLFAGTSQHLARPGEGTLVFPLCKFWSPISKLCSLSNLLILHCQTNLFCWKKLLGLSSSQVHPASCCTDSWAGRALTMSQALEEIKLGCFFSQWK